MEVYVDDMVFKSKERKNYLTHLQESFIQLWKYNIKLNQEKCTSRVASGKFLCYLVTKRIIETNSDQIKVIIKMKLPQTVQEIQSLNRNATAISRFISRSTGKWKPFHTSIKKGKGLLWADECKKAFTKLKEYLLIRHSCPNLLIERSCISTWHGQNVQLTQL